MFRTWLVPVVAIALLTSVQRASAGIVSYDLYEATGSVGGNAIFVRVTLNDLAVPGQVRATITVMDNPSVPGLATGDLRGFFFQTNPDNQSFLNGLMITGADVTAVALGPANMVDSAGSGTTHAVINPLGPFDVGAALGTNGIGSDDIQSTIVFIAHSSGPIDSSIFSSLLSDSDLLGVRVNSIGDVGGPRSSSGKFGGAGFGGRTDDGRDSEIPEPSSLLLWAVGGLGCLGWQVRRRRT